jgi:hypothetical protein
MGGIISPPPPFPTVIPNPVNPNTAGFLISAVEIVSSSSPQILILYAANNLRVGDQILVAGLRTFTTLNNQTYTVLGAQANGAYNPTSNSVTVQGTITIPAGLTGLIDEVGVITRLTPGPSAPTLFFTDPANYEPPTDGSGPLIITRSVMSVEHPGRQIPDTIIGSVVRIARSTLTSAQILALHVTPVQLIPEPVFVPSGIQGTPGPGLAYKVQSISFKYNAGTTPYNRSTQELNIFLGPKANGIAYLSDPDDVTALLESTTDKVWIGAMLNDLEAQDAGNVENQPVIVALDTACTAGDGTLTIIIEYTVLQT